jgi:predicted RNase H-like HicB family nuclease
MKRRLYPAVLERGPKATFGAWFPDFPGCVAGGKSQEETIEKAENTLAQTVDALFEKGRPLPEPTPIEQIALPKGCEFVAYFIVGVDPPDPSERVNVYLPKSLIGRVDKRAAELGMSRSSYFGLAVTIVLDQFPLRTAVHRADAPTVARSKVHKTGGLRTGKSQARASKKPAP